ncbi:MAG TPA: hypothetical protein VFR67_07020 [Pilimelia sp.]|nr:hypothetical protein [Pilimelia sp.]
MLIQDGGVAPKGRRRGGPLTVQRELYLDNLKAILIAAVVDIHGAELRRVPGSVDVQCSSSPVC